MKKICLLTILICSSAIARPIDVNVTDYGWLTSFPPAKDLLDFYLQGVEDDVNEDNPIINPQRINYGTANSSVLASKGLGTDYVNNPERFQISLGLGAAWDNEKNKGLKDEISGAAAASSVTIGARMDQFGENIFGLDSKKLMGYLNFGTFPYEQVIPGEDIDIAGKIDATNFGLHFRYDLVQQKGSDFFGWGGLKLHTGYEFNKNKINLTTNLDEPIELDTGGQGILSGRLVGKPTYDIETTTHSIPIEISSNLLFLNIFSLYGGLGTDFNFGSSQGKGDIKGEVAPIACSSGICVGETVLPQVEAKANFDARSEVKSVTFRSFAGLQVDLPFGLHAYGQYQQMHGTQVRGVSAGLKYTY